MAGSIDSSWAWAIGLISFAFGMACGVGIAYLTSAVTRRTRELQDTCDSLQQELDAYRDQVGQHFRKTADLVQKMTDSYRDVYEHLATGSQSLCREPVSTPSLDIPDRKALAGDEGEKAPEPESPDSFSDAETDGLDDSDSDTLLGDSPRVPVLDTESEPARATPPHRPSQ
jgi:uncharacterized membrane-anchored protein YhcB (DUF1043 family)